MFFLSSLRGRFKMKPYNSRTRQSGSTDMSLVIKVAFAGILLSAVVGIQGWIKHYRMKRDGYVEITEEAETLPEPPAYLTY